ncbi:MAG: molybdopterin-dependent oxidoreductase [Chloroflexi bacterium]|nr:molybdopterin-dependent oxidoreductase [Chloroflexota bacterium]
MGITRRQFLRWSGVSALGAVIFNGCRIPDEELQIESPVDLPEDLVSGIDNWYATLCRQDPGCGIIVRVVEGRAKKVEGNPDYPTNQGKHSARSEAGLQALYHPDRITQPLYREQRSGQLAPIPWSNAREILRSKLDGLQDKSRFRLITEPLRGHLALLASEFVQAYGGRHMAFEPLEQVNLRQAIRDVFGQQRTPDFDIANARYLMSFGADFLSTWQAPVRYARGYGEFRQGENRSRGVHVQVDSRFSMSAANADEWVPVKPGGEGVLAMSMAYVIIRDGLANASAAGTLTGGGGYQALEAFHPGSIRVNEVTGLRTERIEELAHAFADPANQPSLAIGGGSTGAHTSGLFNLKAVYALNLLVNNMNKSGGVIFNPPPPLEELATEDVASIGVPASLKEWQDLSNEGVEVLMVRGANPVHGLPTGASFASAMDNASFVVTFSSFMDETAAASDLVLPEHVYLEDWGDDTPDPGPGYQVLGLQQPVVRPFHPGTRSFADEILLLGNDLGLDLNARLGLEGVTSPGFKDLLLKGAQKLWQENRGSVKATSFEGFWSGVLQRGGWWDLEARADPIVPVRPLDTAWPDIDFQGDTGADTFNLIPFLSNSITDGRLAHLPWLQAAPDPITSMTWHTWVEMNSRTAEAMDIREGDVLEVTSPGGTVQGPAYLHPAVPPWTVSMPVGQGHTQLGQYAQGVGANVISVLAPLADRDTNALAWAATRVRVRKTGRHVDVPKFEGNVPAVEADEGHIVQITRPQ